MSSGLVVCHRDPAQRDELSSGRVLSDGNPAQRDQLSLRGLHCHWDPALRDESGDGLFVCRRDVGERNQHGFDLLDRDVGEWDQLDSQVCIGGRLRREDSWNKESEVDEERSVVVCGLTRASAPRVGYSFV